MILWPWAEAEGAGEPVAASWKLESGGQNTGPATGGCNMDNIIFLKGAYRILISLGIYFQPTMLIDEEKLNSRNFYDGYFIRRREYKIILNSIIQPISNSGCN
jgi:hypothetical protein